MIHTFAGAGADVNAKVDVLADMGTSHKLVLTPLALAVLSRSSWHAAHALVSRGADIKETIIVRSDGMRTLETMLA